MTDKGGKADEWLRLDTYEDNWTGLFGSTLKAWRVHVYSHGFQRDGLLVASGDTREAAQKAAAIKLREFADLLDRGEGKP